MSFQEGLEDMRIMVERMRKQVREMIDTLPPAPDETPEQEANS